MHSNFKRIIALTLAIFILVNQSVYAAEKINKDESVYVNLDQEGSVQHITVSNWLQGLPTGEITDQSSLTDIINIKGDQAPQIKDDSIVWNTNGEDIYYQGTSDKELPIEVKVSYWLDGNPISPDNIAGKSGHVKITLQLINNDAHNCSINGETKTLYTPFIAIAVISLPTNIFENVTINSGKLVNDGNRNVITFVTIPGLHESIGEDNNFDDIINLPETLELEADSNAFELQSIMITTGTDLFDINNIKKADNLTELIEGIDKLKDTSTQLMEGASSLDGGAQSLDEGIDNYYSGICEFNTKISPLFDGLIQVEQNLENIVEGSTSLTSGIETLSQGIIQYGNNASKYVDGIMGYLNGVIKYQEGMQNIVSSISLFSSKALGFADGASQVGDSLSKSITSVEKLKSAKTVETEAIQQLTNSYEDMELLIKQLKEVEGAEQLAAQIEEGLKNQEQAVGQLHQSSVQIQEGMEQLSEGMEQIELVTQQLKVGGEELVNASSELDLGQQSLQAGYQDLENGVEQLQIGATQLEEGSNSFITKTPELTIGANQLSEGLEQIYHEGILPMNQNVPLLIDGLNQLTLGAEELSLGSHELTQGIALYTNNMQKFNDEGIMPLHREVKNNFGKVDKLFQIKDEMVQLANNYNNYAGLGKNMVGDVKFILKTESIKQPEIEEKEIITPEESEKKGFFAWFKSLFNK